MDLGIIRLWASLDRIGLVTGLVSSPSWMRILKNDGHSLSDTQRIIIRRICDRIERCHRYRFNLFCFYDEEEEQRLSDLYKEYEDLGETLLNNPDTPDWKNTEVALNRILDELERMRINAIERITARRITLAATNVNVVPDEEEPKRKLCIRVKTVKGVEHVLQDVTTHTLTKDLKYKIASKEGGVKTDDIILLYEERELCDNDTLDTHGITNGATINMLPRVRGKGLMESAKKLYNETRNILKNLGEWVPGLFADTTRAVTERDLIKIVHAIGKGWEFLGIALGLNDAQLYHISEDNQNGTAKKIYAMLATWLNENQSEATVGKLYKAMNDCGKVVDLNWKKIKEVFSDIVDVVLI